MKKQDKQGQLDLAITPTRWQTVAEIPSFPFHTFEELQQALTDRRYSLGVDSLAAAELAGTFSSRLGNLVIGLLSLLLCLAALLALLLAVWLGNYWLLAGVPIIAIYFFASAPTVPWRRIMSVVGGFTILLALDFWLRDLNTPAYLVGFGAFTFLAVRLANYITRTSLCEAITSTETIFLFMYEQAICTLRDNKTGQVYTSEPSSRA